MAPEHARHHHARKVNKAGLRVLRWLAVYVLEFIDDGTYWNEWLGAEYDGKPRQTLRVATTTIRALRDRKLVRVSSDNAGGALVELTRDGHDYLERATQ